MGGLSNLSLSLRTREEILQMFWINHCLQTCLYKLCLVIIVAKKFLTLEIKGEKNTSKFFKSADQFSRASHVSNHHLCVPLVMKTRLLVNQKG